MDYSNQEGGEETLSWEGGDETPQAVAMNHAAVEGRNALPSLALKLTNTMKRTKEVDIYTEKADVRE